MINEFLLVEYYENRLIPEKRKQVEDWLSESKSHRDEYQNIVKIWERSESLGILEGIDVQNEWKLVLRKYNSLEKPLFKIKRLYQAAASVLIILGVSIVLYWQINKYAYVEVVNDKVDQVENVLLSDGTEVSLNYNSKLTYPKKFKENIRKVTLLGQGYFKVKRNTEAPFFVKTSNGEIEVLGTSFTVTSQQKITCVIVETGIVKLTDNKNNPVILEKGYKGEINFEGISKKLNEDENYLAWKTGVFTFNNTSLDQVFNDLSSKYHFKYKFEDKTLNKRKLTANFIEESLDDILRIIEISCQVKTDRVSDILIISNE